MAFLCVFVCLSLCMHLDLVEISASEQRPVMLRHQGNGEGPVPANKMRDEKTTNQNRDQKKCRYPPSLCTIKYWYG